MFFFLLSTTLTKDFGLMARCSAPLPTKEYGSTGHPSVFKIVVWRHSIDGSLTRSSRRAAIVDFATSVST
jgi:hypothetical protein